MERETTDRAQSVFGNEQPECVYRRAERGKRRYIQKFGDDSAVSYPLRPEPDPVLGESLGLRNLVLGVGGPDSEFDREKGIVIGSIRMGFGHYRIALAMASCAHALGYTPYWMDLCAFPQSTATKVISAQNDLYSLGSRLSQRSALFNRLVWEPLNYEGFRRLRYNAGDQKNAELMAPLFQGIPKEIPVVAAHVWPAQAARHAGMEYVVNAIPDNWPMALHLAEGSLHTVQTHFAYQGYRILNGMDGRRVLHPMPEGALACTGHYVDHEIVRNLSDDSARRCERKRAGAPMRFLLSIGGAGAQMEIAAAVLRHLRPAIMRHEAAVCLNLGDHAGLWEALCQAVPGLAGTAETHFNNWEDTRGFCAGALNGPMEGVHVFCHRELPQAVYSTNLLLRCCDVLLTKPGELSFYPVPKLFLPRVGGHERWGAIHSAEIGDGTLECPDIPHVLQMLDLFLAEDTLLMDMCENIAHNAATGVYDGAYWAVRLAMGLRKGMDEGA